MEKPNHEKDYNIIKSLLAALAMAVLTLPGMALASDIGSPAPEAVKGLYPGKTYSPYAQRSFPSRIYWETRTCTPGCRSMPGCSATSLATKRPTAWHAVKR